MTPDVVHSLVARCLLEPEFLQEISGKGLLVTSDSHLSNDAPVTLAALDLAKLKMFSGLMVKVKHPALWTCLPTTIAILKRAGLEIEVFSEYAPQFLTSRPVNEIQRIDRFADFTLSYFEGHPHHDSPLICVALKHEWVTWRLEQDVPTRSSVTEQSTKDKSVSSLVFGNTIPILCGSFYVATYLYDPHAIIEWVASGFKDEPSIGSTVLYLGYWRPLDTLDVKIIHLDAVSANLLSQIDGKRTVDDLIKLALSVFPGIEQSIFLEYFDTCVELGLASLIE